MNYLKKRLRILEAQFEEALDPEVDPTGSISAIYDTLAELAALITPDGRFESFPEAFAAWEETQQALEDGEDAIDMTDLLNGERPGAPHTQPLNFVNTRLKESTHDKVCSHA